MIHLMRRMASLSVCPLLLVFVVHLRAQLVTLNATSLNFGNQAITSSSSKSIRLTNTGTSPLIITSISQPGAPFLETSDCPLSPALLAPHAHCTISVTYCPTNTARSSGLISIAGNPCREHTDDFAERHGSRARKFCPYEYQRWSEAMPLERHQTRTIRQIKRDKLNELRRFRESFRSRFWLS